MALWNHNDSIVKGFLWIFFDSIGSRLKEERERLGKSQTEIAEIAEKAGAPGATRQSQALYEKGKRMPDAAYLSAIAAAGADVLYILTGSRSAPTAPVLSREEVGMLDSYRHCSKEMQLAARTQLAAMAQPAKDVKKKAA